MPNEFVVKNGLVVSQGGANITGSMTVTGGITGSLFGTSSLAIQATTASFLSTLQSELNDVIIFNMFIK